MRKQMQQQGSTTPLITLAGSGAPGKSAALKRRALSLDVTWQRRVLLALLALVALALRLYGINWDAGTGLHPDEREIVFVTQALSWPGSLRQLLSVRSPLNPHFFAYGSFPLYLLALCVHGLAWLMAAIGHSAWFGSPGGPTFAQFTLVGRALSALADTGTVLLTYLLGRRVAGYLVGVLAATLVAITPFEVQVAHFYAVDTVLVFFVMLTLLSAVALVSERSWRWPIWCGLGLGLAMATKVSAAPLLVPALAATFLRGRNRRSVWAFVSATLVMLGVAVLVFVLTMPYALIDMPDFIAQVNEQAMLVRGLLDYPYVRQFAHTTPYLYEIRNIVLYDQGPALGFAGFIGTGYALVRLWRRWDDVVLLPLLWFLPYFAITGSFYVKFSRYMLPIFPVMAIFAAFALYAFYRYWTRQRVITETTGVPVSPVPARLWVSPFPAQGAKAGWARFVRSWLAKAPIAVTIIVTLILCLALVNIYRLPNTRVQASAWIYQHLPPGTVLTHEVWDDSLPLNLSPTRQAGLYPSLPMDLYADDTVVKAAQIAQTLEQADAVIISSDRLVGSIARMPERYPLTNHYYQLLFAGKLGFHLTHTFWNSPNLFGIYENDSGADESFSVYDHPTVWIFLKDRPFPYTQRQLDTLLLRGVSLPPRSLLPGSEKTLLLSPAAAAANQLSPSFAEQFPASSLANRLPVLAWWLVLELLGLALFPVCALVFTRCRDYGYGLAKTLGLLAMGYGVWMMASLHLAPNTETTARVWLGVLVIAGLAVAVATRQRLTTLVRARWRLLLATEVLFTLGFLLFVGIRMLDPDLWHIYRGGEKPMELAFLNALLRSRYFPPYDPWFAGGIINYYYYGQLLFAVLIKCTGMVPTVAFNLAIPTLAGLLLSGTCSVVLALTRRWWLGMVGALFTCLVSNLNGLLQIIGQIHAALAGLPIPPFDYWQSSRVIPYTINEFPYWSFLFADVHAHVIDLPVEMLMMGLAVQLLWPRHTPIARRVAANEPRAETAVTAATTAHDVHPPTAVQNAHHRLWLMRLGAQLPVEAPALLVASFALGAMACINTWDVPTFALLLIVALLLRERGAGRSWFCWPVLRRLLVDVALLALLSYGLYFPFHQNFQSFVNGVGLSRASSPVGDYLILFGVWLFLTVSFFGAELFDWWQETLEQWAQDHGVALAQVWALRPRRLWGFALASAIVLAFAALLGLKTLLALLIVAGLIVLWRRPLTPARQFTCVMLLGALGLSLMVELVYLKDFLDGGDWFRMNTVFKFYMQVWLFYAVGGALVLYHLRLWVRQWRMKTAAAMLPEPPIWVQDVSRRSAGSVGQLCWSVAFALLLAGSSVFLVAGTVARVSDRAVWEQVQPPVSPLSLGPTLDGMAYMQMWYPGDYQAIRWLNAHISGAPVILEASSDPYQWYGRVSVYTGLPTVMGWSSHEVQQRYPEEVYQQAADATTIYTTPDPNQALALLHRYQVRYIYVGGLENQLYGSTNPQGLAKFARMVGTSLRIVYQQSGVTIYEVVR
jgi:YYY domain-containing protein